MSWCNLEFWALENRKQEEPCVRGNGEENIAELRLYATGARLNKKIV